MEQGIEVVRQEASAIMQWANGLTVTNKEEYGLAFEKVKEIKAVRKRWVDYWQPLKTKAHAAWKEVVAKEKQGTDVLDNAEMIAKRKADAWRQEEERKAAEEQRRLQAIADEKARKERERLEKEAAKLKTPELKQERMEQAASIEAPVIRVEAPPVVAGVSVKKTWKARLVDINALIAEAKPNSIASSFLSFNEQSANSFARSTKGTVKVAGIEFYEDRNSSVKGGI